MAEKRKADDNLNGTRHPAARTDPTAGDELAGTSAQASGPTANPTGDGIAGTSQALAGLTAATTGSAGGSSQFGGVLGSGAWSGQRGRGLAPPHRQTFPGKTATTPAFSLLAGPGAGRGTFLVSVAAVGSAPFPYHAPTGNGSLSGPRQTGTGQPLGHSGSGGVIFDALLSIHSLFGLSSRHELIDFFLDLRIAAFFGDLFRKRTRRSSQSPRSSVPSLQQAHDRVFGLVAIVRGLLKHFRHQLRASAAPGDPLRRRQRVAAGGRPAFTYQYHNQIAGPLQTGTGHSGSSGPSSAITSASAPGAPVPVSPLVEACPRCKRPPTFVFSGCAPFCVDCYAKIVLSNVLQKHPEIRYVHPPPGAAAIRPSSSSSSSSAVGSGPICPACGHPLGTGNRACRFCHSNGPPPPGLG
uniref:Uncharacterized protein n=1 Tax=Aegilops tauschii TaxID=37682 RepID=N1QSW8_AEGTA